MTSRSIYENRVRVQSEVNKALSIGQCNKCDAAVQANDDVPAVNNFIPTPLVVFVAKPYLIDSANAPAIRNVWCRCLAKSIGVQYLVDEKNGLLSAMSQHVNRSPQTDFDRSRITNTWFYRMVTKFSMLSVSDSIKSSAFTTYWLLTGTLNGACGQALKLKVLIRTLIALLLGTLKLSQPMYNHDSYDLQCCRETSAVALCNQPVRLTCYMQDCLKTRIKGKVYARWQVDALSSGSMVVRNKPSGTQTSTTSNEVLKITMNIPVSAPFFLHVL
ncbi:hypothetical protein CLF_105510 [Clonorchis sinensis]|uniref:Uncharacterized protein n=1 Tax=Clonorchis sinensis TaxID=79923 RepID=G7YDM0_CLOSI|nr:hypothetical protein CLF_105510 [Clonorchis sinensis]